MCLFSALSQGATPIQITRAGQKTEFQFCETCWALELFHPKLRQNPPNLKSFMELKFYNVPFWKHWNGKVIDPEEHFQKHLGDFWSFSLLFKSHLDRGQGATSSKWMIKYMLSYLRDDSDDYQGSSKHCASHCTHTVTKRHPLSQRAYNVNIRHETPGRYNREPKALRQL